MSEESDKKDESNLPSPQNGAGKYLLPREKYTEEQLQEIYLPKGKEDGDAIANLEYDEIFIPLMDRILGGMTPRQCTKWLSTTFGIKVKYSAIQQYIDNYFPEALKKSLNLTPKVLRDSKVDPIAIIEDLVRSQKQRLADAEELAKTNIEFRLKFDFNKEISLLHKMAADLLEKKQTLGILPKAPQKHIVENSKAPTESTYPKKEEDLELSNDIKGLKPHQVGRLLHMLDSLKARLDRDEFKKEAPPIEAEVVKETPPPQN